MKMSIKYAGTLALLPTVAVVLAACGGSKVQGTESVAVAAAPGGGAIVVETFTSTATVSALNTKDRKVTLEFPDGKKTTFKATPEMVNYNQLQVGDKVNAVVTEQAVVWLSKNGGPPASAAEGGAVLSPVGAKPGGIAVATVAVTATITAIDQAKGKVTLQFDSG
jgi:predicted small lipoprotein YifL